MTVTGTTSGTDAVGPETREPIRPDRSDGSMDGHDADPDPAPGGGRGAGRNAAARSPSAADGSHPTGPGVATTVGYALLFAVPVAVGVPLAVTRVTGEPFFTPVVAGPGLVAGLAVFLLVVLAARGGSVEE